MKKLTLLLTATILFGAFPARAADDEAAKKAFTEAKVFFAEENYDQAAASFRAAYDAKPTWKLLFNIGQAEAAAKHYGLALEAFESYLAEAGDELTEDRLAEVHKEVSRLRNMVGVLNVDTHEGAEIIVNGISRGVAPIHAGISLAGGKTHRVEVIYNGTGLPPKEVRVAGGRSATVEIMQTDTPEITDTTNTPDSVESAKAAESQDTGSEEKLQDGGNGLKVAGIVTLSVGLAGIAGGAVTGAIALSKNSLLKDNCQGGVCDDEYEDDQNLRDTMGLTSTILFGVGAAAVTVGTIMLVVNKKKSNERLSLFPVIGPRVAGAGLAMQF